MGRNYIFEDIEFYDYINDCVPYFIGFFLLENLLSIILKKKDLYLFKDSFSSLSTGLSTIIWEKIVPSTFLASIEFVIVLYIWRYHRLIDIAEDNKIASIICFLSVDFGYYWFHRLAHEVNYMWATHVTHHSSEKYNLTTALRQSVFQIYTSWVFYLPLGLFIPPQMYMFHKQFNTIYQYWIHTKYIGKLGPLEWIINTPSHHRVHHARNPRYIDRNYAGTLIIWDRMFGTFIEEEEEVFYGLVHPLGSHDPTWCQIHHWYEMYQQAKQYPAWGDKIRVYLNGPGWHPGTARLGDVNEIPMPTKEDIPERLGQPLPALLNSYVFVHFMLISIASLAVLAIYEHSLGYYKTGAVMVYLYLSLTCFGAIFDRKRFAMLAELIRLVMFIGCTWEIQSSVVQYMRLFYFISAGWMIANNISSSTFKTIKKD
ncbi:hypothetical protein SAMD00019534_115300 [Acytostelium subglobosum LB1]|uniref:hypothetical protein n=1 Tax=Acytostelium subglobosum LB1 TaxID=1410327 RepID=UPI000644CD4F|nr:hypothetical protein SAMD00019534_115300 [Acytostelium subglobosum LB1]GAM28354.1 hypothetical protein SAMD00019534_115300 [Acytostelium subglobosum LB1]|eukprot:XP_012748671.1 hypothetical protein SAMD00019534_115300 [Acytostelium subglobosum LB1]